MKRSVKILLITLMVMVITGLTFLAGMIFNGLLFQTPIIGVVPVIIGAVFLYPLVEIISDNKNLKTVKEVEDVFIPSPSKIEPKPIENKLDAGHTQWLRPQEVPTVDSDKTVLLRQAPAYSLTYSLNGKSETVPINKFPVSIGRSTEIADIVIVDSSISRQHLKLDSANGELTIQDLGSSNGTTINGQNIQGVVAVNEGDKIFAGRISMTINQN